MKAYTLFELNEHIRRVLALNLPEALWVSCEIAQLKEARGHFFLQLVQKEENGDNIIAQIDAVLWQSDFRQLQRKTGAGLSSILQEGREVLIKAKVGFNERYGLKLTIEDIDPSYTLGKLELLRRQTIAKLQELQLIELNAGLRLPLVLQQIAVLTSETAAGYKDYLEHLHANPYGYQIKNQLFSIAVQGDQVEPESLRQLKKIKSLKDHFDCVIIIRGGGARLDLSAFDKLELCKAIANFPLPVLSGIGHEIDETVLDLVAHTSLKTPTAVADFIIERNLQFENTLLQLGKLLYLLAGRNLKEEELQLQQTTQQLGFLYRNTIRENSRSLEFIETELPQLLHYRLNNMRQQLDQLEKINALLDPDLSLQRGFSLTLKDGKVVTSAANLKKGDHIVTRFKDGAVKSEVEGPAKHKK